MRSNALFQENPDEGDILTDEGDMGLFPRREKVANFVFMEVSIFKPFGTSPKDARIRHFSVLLAAIVVNWLVWFILDWENNSRLEGWAFVGEVLVDLWQGVIETVFIVETTLLMTKVLIKVLWKGEKTLRRLVLLCLALLAVVTVVSALVAAVYLHFYPDKKNIFEDVFLCDVITTYFLTSIFFISFLANKLKDEKLAVLAAETDSMKAQNLVLRSRLDMLKLKTDNHFVFNSLSTLEALIESEPEEAARFCQSLSRMYRYIVLKGDKKLVPLSEDLAFMEDYRKNCEIRLSGVKLQIETDPNRPSDLMVPPLTLQELVRNAIQHNKHGIDTPLKIRITVEGDCIVVENNVLPMAGQFHESGTGLETLAQRYRLLAGKDIEFLSTEKHFAVRLPVIRTQDLHESVDY